MTFDLRQYLAVAAWLLAAFAAQFAVAQTPAVSGVSISSTPVSGDTYQLAEIIEVRITFDQNVTVSGEPSLALTIGSTTRQASLDLLATEDALVVFNYFVRSLDSDADGISIGLSALALGGGAISNVGGTTNASLDLGSHAISNAVNHKVDGSMETAPTVSGLDICCISPRDTFELAERIYIEVAFDRAVNVTGAPQLALAIGSTTRQAGFDASTDPRTLQFSYAVQSSDSDTDGISTGSNALSLNGGTIRVGGGITNGSLGLGSHAISNSADHKVDGSVETAPEVLNVYSDGPADGDTYELGEVVVVYMFFFS